MVVVGIHDFVNRLGAFCVKMLVYSEPAVMRIVSFSPHRNCSHRRTRLLSWSQPSERAPTSCTQAKQHIEQYFGETVPFHMKKDRFAFEAERNNTNNAPFLCNAKTLFTEIQL
jgi:hypothetical protein